jgi:hypothetical protein
MMAGSAETIAEDSASVAAAPSRVFIRVMEISRLSLSFFAPPLSGHLAGCGLHRRIRAGMPQPVKMESRAIMGRL